MPRAIDFLEKCRVKTRINLHDHVYARPMAIKNAHSNEVLSSG